MAAPVRPPRDARQQAPLQLRIGTLSLPGASPAQAQRIGEALCRELGVLLAHNTGGAFVKSRQQARIDGGTLSMSPTERPEVIGRRLARVIARSLRQQDSEATGDAP